MESGKVDRETFKDGWETCKDDRERMQKERPMEAGGSSCRRSGRDEDCVLEAEGEVVSNLVPFSQEHLAPTVGPEDLNTTQKATTMAGEVPLQLLQEMQRQMQEMRAEMAAMRAERGEGRGGPSVQSVNVETINSRSDDNQPTVQGNAGNNAGSGRGVGRGNNRGGGRNRGGRGNGRGRGRGEGRGVGINENENEGEHEVRNHGESDGDERGNGTEEYNCRRVGEIPDQAEGLQPFTTRVMRATIPENKVLPSMERYEPLTNPVKHLRSFVDAMAVYLANKLVWCRVFSLSLKGEALDWFHSLLPRSIDGFATLRQLFSQQYVSNRTPGVTYNALVRLRQGRDEPLKTFMDRFNRTARQVRNADQRMIVSALTTALQPGPFVDYLYAEEPQTMDELHNRLASFIRIEEGRSHQRSREEGESASRMTKDRRGERRGFGRVERGNGLKREGRLNIPQYVHHTPLNAPRARVMEEALRADLLAVVRAPTPSGADESKYCCYHHNRGHTTEDCTTLKDKLESLVQQGHLRQFVQRGRPVGEGRGNVNTPRRGQDGEKRGPRSRSRSRERTVRGVINTISGGFADGGPTVAARKRHLRGLHHVNQARITRKSMPVISFSDADFHAVDPDQDDPMVITTMVAWYQIGKTLIDQGSSTNILYWKTFQQMDISEEAVMPFHEQIVGFAGERVDTKGYIDLETIVTDNGRQFIDKKLVAFYRELGITLVTSSVEHPQTNGQAEAANKIILQELKKILGEAKGRWVEEIDQILWGYWCSPHSSTGESPFNLTYGSDAMLLV
ncbi:uncharacterized protein LOC106778524 [Vigna radiata var. radiata]|uniref:Uncharacterized protein LOC106778524 n=1 Tax=Vigna radiata var. radiata TaxID=3916 RepID=A0A1S3VUX4_VIGRR|nr:uncharacterized protein LOC106778524 [Vigna radiata var. radiata]